MNFNRKKHHRSLGALSACLIATFSLNSSVLAQDIWYVDGDVSECDNDGETWANAFKFLQDALNNPFLVAGDRIWVAATVSNNPYRTDDDCANPNGTGVRTTTFQLIKDVFLLGGFDGTELFGYERDPILNVTVLSGDVATIPPTGSGDCYEENGTPGCDEGDCEERVCVDSEFEECCDTLWDGFCATRAIEICGEAFHVVTAGSEIDDPDFTVIDGFTIRDGTANGVDPLEDQGGGMLIEGEPSVIRCIFTQNTAYTSGGGMTINGEFIRPHIINSVFDDNPGDQPLIPPNGGGLSSIGQSDPTLTNCLFVENASGQAGAAIYNEAATCEKNPPPGGACGRITLINCTVANNTADLVDGGHKGGGLYFGGQTGRLEAENTIVWGNAPTADQIDGGGLTSDEVNYSDCQGGCPDDEGGTGNINVNPDFVFAPGNWRLKLDSLAIDAGNTDVSVIPCDFFNLDNDILDCTFMADEATPDLDLINRILDGDDDDEAIVDMGAYEFCHPDSCPWDLDGDGVVGAGDLLILLANWDNPYGSFDLLGLLVDWGPCPCDLDILVLSLEDELALHCLDLTDWAIFEDKMQNGTEAEKENHLCWMLHYLEDCSKCFCVGASGCPGADPYN